MKKRNLVLFGTTAMLSLALAGTIGAVTASATEITQGTEGRKGTTTVTYSVSDSWSVTIPESIVVGGAGGDVVVKDVVIKEGNQLKVTVASAHSWKVQDEAGHGFTYQLKADGSEVITGDVLAVDAGTTEEQKKSLTAELNDPTNSGKYSTGGESYSDTLTFTVTSEVKAG